jgi:hypothetical protein
VVLHADEMDAGVHNVSEFSFNTTAAMRRLYVGYVDVVNQFNKDIQTNTLLAESIEKMADLEGGSLSAALYVFSGCLINLNATIKRQLETSSKVLIAKLAYEFRQTQALQHACQSIKKTKNEYKSASTDRDNKKSNVERLQSRCDAIIQRHQSQPPPVEPVSPGHASAAVVTVVPVDGAINSDTENISVPKTADTPFGSETDDTCTRASSVDRFTGVEANGRINNIFAEDHVDHECNASVGGENVITSQTQQTINSGDKDIEGLSVETSRNTITLAEEAAPATPVFSPKEQQQFVALAAAQSALEDAVNLANFAHRKYATGYQRLQHGFNVIKAEKTQDISGILKVFCYEQAEFHRLCGGLWEQLVSTFSNSDLISSNPVWDADWLEEAEKKINAYNNRMSARIRPASVVTFAESMAATDSLPNVESSSSMLSVDLIDSRIHDNGGVPAAPVASGIPPTEVKAAAQEKDRQISVETKQSASAATCTPTTDPSSKSSPPSTVAGNPMHPNISPPGSNSQVITPPKTPSNGTIVGSGSTGISPPKTPSNSASVSPAARAESTPRKRTLSGTFMAPFTAIYKVYTRRQQRLEQAAEVREREASRANEITWPFNFTHVYHVTLDPESTSGFSVSQLIFDFVAICH